MTQQTARGLAALGRGPDTELVHMAPSEVAGLQALAKAHGGSLTLNPQTGLPEAGFLSSILPMVIGAGLTAASGGTLTPLMAAMMTGGGYAVATGSLKKGLMAGFGAYGGAGIGSALAGAGAQGLATAAIPTVDAGAAMAAGAGDATANLAANATVPTGISGGLSNMGTGIQGLGSEAGRTAFMQNIGGGKGLAMAGLAAASPMLMPETATQQPEIKTDKDMGQRYSYSPGETTPTPTPDVPGYGAQDQNFGREQMYFKPQYTQIDNAAARKLYGFAAGGPVEAMSNANALGANTGYPQADIRTSAYSTPFQQPSGQNVVAGSQDVAVDPYTGQEQRTAPAPQAQFADGGGVGGYSYDPATQKFSSGQPAEISSPANSGLSELLGMARQARPATYAYDPKLKKYTQTSAAVGAVEPVAEVQNHGGGMASGGLSDLGGYSDGGRLLRGPGDGISDSIPAMIGKKQPARLADGEFVVPARIVSELGNGSTEAGARKLYGMMDRVQKSRGKTVGKGKIATNSRAEKHLPA